jgi:HEAT repeat protein
MLKPRSQAWRYKIKIRTALEKIDNTKNNEEEKNEIKEEEKDELDYEINFEYLETIIDFLINNLSDKEYIVRWSAAKGLGRLCERLTKSMVEEIFGELFD